MTDDARTLSVRFLMASLTDRQQAKLEALAEMAGQPVHDLVGLMLSGVIETAWDGYRANPKHTAEIEAWEKEHGEGKP